MLGRISGLFGVRGWVRVYSYTEPREAILEYQRWYLSQDDGWRPEEVTEGRHHGKSIVAHLAGFDDRDAATRLLDCKIAVARGDLPDAGTGRYYWADLEGLAVVHRDGTPLGKVAGLLATGANDVLVTDGERERLIPFVVDKVILDVDFDNGVIIVDWEWD